MTAQVSFADVRANLRHAGTPVEAPINSSFTAPASTTTKRVGQPTIGVPADKMAAFLKEMKSVRLRRVFNAPTDMCRPTPRVGSADSSFIGVGIQRPPRAADGTVAVGEKRKRETETLAKEGVHSIRRRLMCPIPRSADSSFSSTNSSFSQSQSSLTRSQSQSQSEAGPSKLSRSYIPVRAWPSSSVDGTDVTPSLTSDGDAEQGPDEPSPPTPPQVPAIVVQGQEEAEEALPAPPPPDSDLEGVTPVPRPPTPPRRSYGISAQSVFDKRQPRSPLPAEPSPRKARPPSRKALRPRILDESAEEEDGDDDPLARAVPDSPLAAVSARPRRERRPATTTTVAAAAGTGGGVPRQARRRGSMSSTQSGGASSKSARRRTLDEELRNSDGITEEDLRVLDLEPHVFTAVGTRNERKGFLAHGGGAGIPVFMGAATEEHEDDDIEIIDPPPPPPAPLVPKKARGRGRASANAGMRRR